MWLIGGCPSSEGQYETRKPQRGLRPGPAIGPWILLSKAYDQARVIFYPDFDAWINFPNEFPQTFAGQLRLGITSRPLNQLSSLARVS